MLTAEKQKATYDDYALLPEGAKYQLIDGEIIEMPTPIVAHQNAVLNLGAILREIVMKKKLGRILIAPMDVFLDPYNTFQPDVMFISNERLSIIGTDIVRGAPDLVVEVLSPSTAYYDLRKKMPIYFKYGVKECWIIDVSERAVERYALNDGEPARLSKSTKSERITTPILPDLNLSVEEIFA
ncbi:MAG: Uma2 family endonuclease [Chloroherpetonaceae bacterium]